MFDDMKIHNGKVYSGMTVGSAHLWDYRNAVWEERKIAPDEWAMKFTATKHRHTAAPEGSGVPVGSQYHWYIIADQVVKKISANEYTTTMEGAKWKIGHKRPYWRGFSYIYPEQKSYRQRVIEVLRDTLLRLETQELEGQMERAEKEVISDDKSLLQALQNRNYAQV